MENLTQDRQIEDFAPPFSGLFGLINLGWIIVSIFDERLDPEKWIFLGLMIAGAVLTAYYLIIARREKEPLQQTAAFFYLITWLGISLFSNMNKVIFTIELIDPPRTIILKQIMYAALLPVLLIWIQPSSSDYFFGLQEVNDEEKTKSLWKISIILILLINIFQLPSITEYLILIPLIYEHTSLYRMKKDALPVLTLHIQRELLHKFSVPISMLKGVTLIMTAFLFEMITSRFWLLILLLYFVMAIVWFIDFLVPESMRESSIEDFDEDEIEAKIEEKIENFFSGKDSKGKEANAMNSEVSEITVTPEMISTNNLDDVPIQLEKERDLLVETRNLELNQKHNRLCQPYKHD